MNRRATLVMWVLVILAALLPIVLLSLYSFGVASSAVRALARSDNRSAAHFAADVIERDFAQALGTVTTFSLLPEMRAAVESRDLAQTRARLAALVQAFPRIDLALVTDTNGVVWTGSPATTTLGSAERYRRVGASGTPLISEAHAWFDSGPPRMVVDIAAPVRDGRDNVIGVVVCNYRLDALSEWFRGIHTGRTGQVFLVDSHGTVAAHPTIPPGDRSLARYSTHPLLESESATVSEFADPISGEAMIGSRSAVRAGGHDWSVIAQQPRREAFAPVTTLAFRITFASSILALAAATLVAVLEGSRKRNNRLNQQLKEHVQELHHSEQTLARERFLVDTLMENIPDHIYFKDRDSRFIRVNPAMARIFKLDDPAEAIGKADYDFFTPEHAQRALEDEQEILRSGCAMVNREEKETWPDGSVTWVSTTKQCLRAKDGSVIGTFGISRDITERKRAEQALALKAQELARSNEDLEQFAYAASHDLQEPLRMIASYTQLLARRYQDKLDDDAQTFINYAVDGATRMQVLINDLLTYSRVGTRGKPFQTVEAAEILRRVQLNLQVALQESRAVLTVDSLPSVHCDITQMTQLFQNLIANAIKFRGADPPQVRISARLETPPAGSEEDDGPRPEWIFTVRDNGIGIDPQYFDRIFVIFQRLHNRTEYPGTGIGLSVCKKIVERHGGRIWVESQPGQGTAFHFSIPQTLPES